VSERVVVSAEELRGHCLGVLRKVGLREAHAALVSESLVFADLRGVASHGVVRLPAYLVFNCISLRDMKYSWASRKGGQDAQETPDPTVL
jgi:hypothetical protein